MIKWSMGKYLRKPIMLIPMLSLAGTATAHTVVLTWDAPVNTPVVSYTIWRGGSLGMKNPVKIGTIPGTQTSFTDVAPIVGTRFYEVKANEMVDGVLTPVASNVVKVYVPSQ